MVTGLLSESSFWDRLERAVARSDRHQWSLGVMYLELEAFLVYAYDRGKEAGDALFRRAAVRLNDRRSPNATLARIGEAGFGPIVTDAEAVANMDAIRNQLRVALADLALTDETTAGPQRMH